MFLLSPCLLPESKSSVFIECPNPGNLPQRQQLCTTRALCPDSPCSSLSVEFQLLNRILLTQTELGNHDSWSVADTRDTWSKDGKFSPADVTFLGDSSQEGFLGP